MLRWLMKRFGLGVLVLAVSGCVHAVSESVRQQADQSVSFVQLSADPQAYLERVVIVGGTVLETQNVDKTTLLEILQRLLDGRSYWIPGSWNLRMVYTDDIPFHDA